MKLYSLLICKWNPGNSAYILSSAYSLSTFSYFERGSIKELCVFISRTIAPKLIIHSREIIAHDQFIVCGYKWNDGLTILSICDSDYPTRIAFRCIMEIYNDFSSTFSNDTLNKIDCDYSVRYPQLREFLQRYKNPLAVDSISLSQMKVEQAHDTLRRSLKVFLDRGENIEDLVQKSQDLSETSKALFKSSKKMKKSCCSLQ